LLFTAVRFTGDAAAVIGLASYYSTAGGDGDPAVSATRGVVSLFEDAPADALLGTVAFDGNGTGTWTKREWEDPVVVDEDNEKVQIVPGSVARPAEPWENGFKDTVIAYPGQVTRVRQNSTRPGNWSGTATS